MKLYYSAGSCGLASQIALREAGQRFDLVAVPQRVGVAIASAQLLVVRVRTKAENLCCEGDGLLQPQA